MFCSRWRSRARGRRPALAARAVVLVLFGAPYERLGPDARVLQYLEASPSPALLHVADILQLASGERGTR